MQIYPTTTIVVTARAHYCACCRKHMAKMTRQRGRELGRAQAVASREIDASKHDGGCMRCGLREDYEIGSSETNINS